MTGPVTLRADPVTLRAVPVREVRALLDGGAVPGRPVHPDYPLPGSLDAMAMLLGAHEAVTGSRLVRRPAWWIHQIVLDAIVVGDIGFHGPPPAEPPYEVEIGYLVVPGLRGRGVATHACAQLMRLAWRGGADVVRAETEPGNAASERVLEKNGFGRHADGGWTLSRVAS